MHSSFSFLGEFVPRADGQEFQFLQSAEQGLGGHPELARVSHTHSTAACSFPSWRRCAGSVLGQYVRMQPFVPRGARLATPGNSVGLSGVAKNPSFMMYHLLDEPRWSCGIRRSLQRQTPGATWHGRRTKMPAPWGGIGKPGAMPPEVLLETAPALNGRATTWVALSGLEPTPSCSRGAAPGWHGPRLWRSGANCTWSGLLSPISCPCGTGHT